MSALPEGSGLRRSGVVAGDRPLQDLSWKSAKRDDALAREIIWQRSAGHASRGEGHRYGFRKKCETSVPFQSNLRKYRTETLVYCASRGRLTDGCSPACVKSAFSPV